MNSLNYIGEHLWLGNVGHFLVLLAFISLLCAIWSYAKATNLNDQSWQKIGRYAYITHGVALLTVIGLIFYAMLNQFYEYKYVWEHVSPDLEKRYMFSAFWEGQEGSFLLWMFWHIILGFFLIRKAKDWESPVMACLSGIQAFLASMIVGVYFTDTFRVGSSPFILVREFFDGPIFDNPEYVNLIEGQGLNELLQNYWMTIHPPTLFLGFAAVSIPFCYAIAGLWTKRHTEWLKPVLPWTLFTACILGTGILMGSAWAYEALSFGGYWAWDPVENASLVPWILLIAGLHTVLIAKATGQAIKASYLFFSLSFVLTIYSTYLTRSGILGDTSAHAFTEMGLEWQLILFIISGLGLTGFLFFRNLKSISVPKNEEATSSREFWMFIGSLVLLFSSVLITYSTSLPVINKIAQIFNPEFDDMVINDPVEHYNKYQMWIAVFIGLLSGLAQYLRYKEFNWASRMKKVGSHVGGSLLFAGVLTYLTTQWINAVAWQYILLLFTALFGILSNIDYFINFAKSNVKAVGSVMSHVGFGLMIVGIMASGLNKRYLSSNQFAQAELVNGLDLRKNITLLKDEPMFMNGYWVTYTGDTIRKTIKEYEVTWVKKDDVTGEIVESFVLNPNVQYDKKLTKVAAQNPSTKRYAFRDVFTVISGLPPEQIDVETAKEIADTLDWQRYDVKIGEVLDLKKSKIIIESLTLNPDNKEYQAEEDDMSAGVQMSLWPHKDITQKIDVLPMLAYRGQFLYRFPAQANPVNTRIMLADEFLQEVYQTDENLSYEDVVIKQNETVDFKGYKIHVVGIDQEASHPYYTKQEGDVPANILIKVQGPNGNVADLRPMFLLRNNQTNNLKDYAPGLGLHARIMFLDPVNEAYHFSFALDNRKDVTVPLLIAENVPRNDYIVLEAIEFPGINFFWLGTLMMMLGFGFSLFQRLKGN